MRARGKALGGIYRLGYLREKREGPGGGRLGAGDARLARWRRWRARRRWTGGVAAPKLAGTRIPQGRSQGGVVLANSGAEGPLGQPRVPWIASTGGVRHRRERRKHSTSDLSVISKKSRDLAINKNFLYLPGLK